MSALPLLDEFLENQPHYLCALRVDGHFPVGNIIAKHTSPEYNALLHLPLLAPFDPLRCPSALLLSNGGHNGQPQLRITVQSVDVVIHKDNTYTQLLQLPGIGDAIQCISGETGYFLGHNQIQFSVLGAGNHPVKCFSFFCSGSGQPFIGKHLEKFPFLVALDVLAEIALLALKGIGLIFIVRRNTAVCGDPLFCLLESALLIHQFIAINRHEMLLPF